MGCEVRHTAKVADRYGGIGRSLFILWILVLCLSVVQSKLQAKRP
jgi:hypothetical protein